MGAEIAFKLLDQGLISPHSFDDSGRVPLISGEVTGPAGSLVRCSVVSPASGILFSSTIGSDCRLSVNYCVPATFISKPHPYEFRYQIDVLSPDGLTTTYPVSRMISGVYDIDKGRFAEELSDLIRPDGQAVDRLISMVSSRTSIKGYAPDDALTELFKALGSFRLTYASTTGSPIGSCQRVRPIEEVLDSGTFYCAESTVLISSFLLRIGAAPFLMVFKDHVMPAILCTVDDNSVSETALKAFLVHTTSDDGRTLGLLPIESTFIGQGTYLDAAKSGYKTYSSDPEAKAVRVTRRY